MNDKEKQINISTKEEIETRNKTGKEKDELKQALLHYATAEASGGIKTLIDCEGCAFYLYEILGYRKLPENAVVLTQDEVDEFRKDQGEVKFLKKQIIDQARKETAERDFCTIIKALEERKERVKRFYGIAESVGADIAIRTVKKIAKQFGVEIKE